MTTKNFHIALVGNPNSGKTSLFNALTGMNQKVGNFAGVTVEKKTGKSTLANGQIITVLDLPGTYSLYPKSADEEVTYEVLINDKNEHHPDLIVVVADATNLKRNLLFCTQIMDLNTPVILALTMQDLAKNRGIKIDVETLSKQMSIPVVSINPRKEKGISALKRIIETTVQNLSFVSAQPFIVFPAEVNKLYSAIKNLLELKSNYTAMHLACNYPKISFLNAADRIQIGALVGESHFVKSKEQAAEIINRFEKINSIINHAVIEESPKQKRQFTEKIDKILLHPLKGNVILFLVLFLLFQSIFWLAKFPMDLIQNSFAHLGSYVGKLMPIGVFRDLIVNGIIAGISGVMVFVPQIMILFGLITILEDSGYMARISFLSDRVMRSVGLNGRAVMPMISGIACAVPAIMATRTISNLKERLITILITPLMSCSARLPVYTILISLVIPQHQIFGVFNLQGLVLMGLYLLGFIMAMLVAKGLNFLIKVKDKSIFLLELPIYRTPRWKNVFLIMVEKGRIFIKDVGKVILIISIGLWVLAYFGPTKQMKMVELRYQQSLSVAQNQSDSSICQNNHAADKLENSFAGNIGKSFEPLIKPLGFDWKIGIALITSFAAREVFVGTMATLYSVGNESEKDKTLVEKMQEAKKPDGSPVYNLATGLALMVFYVFAMQCISTLAVVKRETKSWKWPIIQFLYMFSMAYFLAMLTYHLVKVI